MDGYGTSGGGTSELCPSGQVVKVTKALLGRAPNSDMCYTYAYPGSCPQVDVLQYYTDTCTGSPYCALSYPPSAVQDPCPGVRKYIELEWCCAVNTSAICAPGTGLAPPDNAGCAVCPKGYFSPGGIAMAPQPTCAKCPMTQSLWNTTTRYVGSTSVANCTGGRKRARAPHARAGLFPWEAARRRVAVFPAPWPAPCPG